MKKILIFSIAYYPLVGGAEVAIKEITDRIDDIRFDMVTLQFDKKSPKIEKIGNVNIYRISCPKLFFPILAFLKAQKLNKENSYNLIWSVMAAYGGFAALFFKLTHPKIPYLLTLQEGDPIEYIKKKVRLVYPLFSRIFTKADYIQAISNYLANWSLEMGAKCPVEVVPNGVDVKKFQFSNSNFQSNSKLQNEKILITVSRLVKKNAVGDIIESLQYLPENVKFWILGEGPEEKNLKFKIKNLKLENRVKFLGLVSQDELPKYLKISDVFVRPSLSEGLGNAFLEAMAAGLPVIATPVGGIPDFLNPPTPPYQGGEKATGLFCEINNPQDIAEKVKLLLSDRELRNKIIFNAHEMVIKNYDWNLIVPKMRKILDKIAI